MIFFVQRVFFFYNLSVVKVYIINELICIDLLNTKIEYENGKHFSGKYGRVRELVTGTLLLDSDVLIPFFADTDFCIPLHADSYFYADANYN